MKKFLVILLFLLSPTLSKASFEFNKNCIEAYDLILSLRFTEAQKLILSEKHNNPDNAIPTFLENYIDFLSAFIGEEEGQFNKLTTSLSDRKERIEKEKENSPYYRYCLATMDMQVAFTRMKFGQYVKAATEINRAYRLLEKNKRTYPDFVPQQVVLGMLHTLIGSIPDKYSWVKNAVGLRGSVSGGINEMQEVLNISNDTPRWKFLQSETLFMLSLASVNLSADKNFSEKLLHFYNTNDGNDLVKSNPLLSYCKAIICFKRGLNDQGIQVLLSRPKGPRFFHFHYLDYLLGVAKLNRLDTDSWTYLISFTANFNGKNFIRSAYQHLAWYYLLNGDERRYKEFMNRIHLTGDNTTDSDKKALRDAESKELPNIQLLKAQLLFDGGYYDRALTELSDYNKNPSRSEHFQLEYFYRAGRIYHESGKIAEAIRYYKLTIDRGEDKPWYFAANAALQLGLIYENRKNKDTARVYYQKSLSMNPTEYKNSIAQKAQAGLSRLNR